MSIMRKSGINEEATTTKKELEHVGTKWVIYNACIEIVSSTENILNCFATDVDRKKKNKTFTYTFYLYLHR